MQDREITRREFVGQGIAAGFALATLPVTAWAVTTPSDGLIAGPITIPTADGGPMPAYRARPASGVALPTIIVIHEVFGVHEYIQDVCRRLAKQGYFAVAPYLYFRQGDVTKLKDIQQILPFVQKVDQPHVWSDLDALIKYLPRIDEPATHSKWTPLADVSKLGITGFCWGGGVVWNYCARNPAIKAGVAWYGPLAGTPSPGHTQFPIDVAATLKTPVLGLYGGKDTHILPEHVAKMREELQKGASHSEIVVYPEAEHGFHADYRPSYNAKAAEDGWARELAWFRKYGVVASG